MGNLTVKDLKKHTGRVFGWCNAFGPGEGNYIETTREELLRWLGIREGLRAKTRLHPASRIVGLIFYVGGP